MMQTLKSILARPAHSTALFIEIVIVTVIGWIAIEPVAIDTTTAALPTGYDSDRLVSVSFSYFDRESDDFDSTLYNAENIRKEKDQLLRIVRDREGTASATFHTFMSIEQPSSSTSNIEADTIYRKYADDETENNILIYNVKFLPNTDFFKTFGIKGINGKQFEEPAMNANEKIVSRTLAYAISPEEKAIGKDLFPFDADDEDARHSPIAAVTEDVSYGKNKGRTALAFQTINEHDYGYIAGITIRVADGISPDSFLARLSSDIKDLRFGNTYLSEPKLYSDLRDELFTDKQKDLNKEWIILGFFLINVFLGISGTFYIQCRTRIPDAGVMRAFGATRRRISLNIIGEAWLTVFIGWIFGSILCLLYLHHQALPMETDAGHVIRAIRPLWHDTTFGRYSVVGGCVLILLLLTATLGAWLPARRVGHANIVEALRDE